MDLIAARDASTRLEPLRRLLADVKLAVDGAVQAQQDQQEAATAVEVLRAQAEDLAAQLANLKALQAQTRQFCEIERDRYQALAAQQSADYQAQKDAAVADLAGYKAQLEAERLEAGSAHIAQLMLWDKERAEAEQDLADVQGALETLQARVKGI